MNGKVAALVAMGVILTAGPARADDDDWVGNFNLLAGVKMMESDWKPADDQRAFGAQFDARQKSWPINLFAGYTFADSPAESVSVPSLGDVTNESRTDELDLGLRKYFEKDDSDWKPFIGAGVAMLRGELESRGPISAASDSDTAVGYWVHGGAVYNYKSINLGAQVKFSRGKIDIHDEKLDPGGVSIVGLLGFRFE